MKKDFRGSEVSDFLRCRKRYDYAWFQNLEPKQRNEKLTIGSAIHKFLETWYHFYNLHDAIENMMLYIDENTAGMEELAVQDMKELAEGICRNYVTNYGHDHNWTVKAVEMPFNVRLSEHTNYVGTIDLVVEDEDGRIWFIDHKTTAAIDIYDKNSDMDRQISRYWWALEQLGYEVHGFIYNIILKDVPSQPKQLKSGALSKDKVQKTTYELYMQAIEDNKLNVDDYSDFLDYLQQQPKEFFRRIKVERTEAERLHAITEMEQVIDDIQFEWLRKRTRMYRNITKDCHWDCPYRTLCVAEMDGSNADHIRDELFKVKEDVE